MPSLFECSGLHVKVDRFQLYDINFSVDRNDYLIVLGPTGCGKTMLLEALAGLRKPASGRIFLEDKDITCWPPEARGLGFAYQDSLLYPFLNVKDNILFGARAKGRHKEKSTRQRLDRLAETMGIAHLLQRYPHFLSGGEKQRVSLARAIMTNPPVLLLDEPLSALDPQKRHSMRELLQELQQLEGLRIIHVTHDFNEALQLGTYVLVMHDGRVLQQGTPGEVFQRPSSLLVSDFLQNENIIRGKIESRNGGLWFKAKDSGLTMGPWANHNSASRINNSVYLMFQAGQISVYPDDGNPAQRPNIWKARLEKVTTHSTHISLVCKGGGSWNVALSRKEWQQLGLAPGARVILSVEGQHPHLIDNQ